MYEKKRAEKLVLFCLILYTFSTQFVDSKWFKADLPTVDFRPMAPGGGTLIWYRASNKSDTRYWINELNNFLSAYTKPETSENAQNCADLDKPAEGKFCEFQISNNQFAPCTQDFDYGYNMHGPCIFLKLNKIFGWVPDYYNSSTAPNSIPKEVRNAMIRNEMRFAELHSQRLVWVDCAGENPADVENIGTVHYYPHRGFHEKYFPFQNIKGYLSPLVAVHFENPKRGVLINVECKAWARNIHHNRVDRQGLVHFELMVDY